MGLSLHTLWDIPSHLMRRVLVTTNVICCKLLEEMVLFLPHPFPLGSIRKHYNE